jgi:lambda repressor-like predicted transcriptional regulator
VIFDRAMVQRLRAGGRSLAQISAETGLAKTTIRRALASAALA